MDSRAPLVAIVDDSDSIRDAMSSLLRSAGLRTTAFESAEEFLGKDCKHEIACLIEMNVLIPTIFVTRDADTVRPTALAQGAVAVLKKPFDAEVFLNAVQSALDSPD